MSITIDGKQAENQARVLEASFNRLKTEIDETRKQMDDLQKVDSKTKEQEKEIEALTNEFSKLKEEEKAVRAAMKLTEQQTLDITKVMDNLSGQTLANLQKSLRALRAQMMGASEDNGRMEELRAQYEAIDNQIKKLKNGLVDVGEVLRNTNNYTPDQIKQAITHLNAQLDKMTLNDPKRDGLKQQIQSLKNALTDTRNETVNVQDVLRRLPNASLKELEQAARQLKEEMYELDTTTEKYTKYKAEYIQIQNRIGEINNEFTKQNSVVGNLTRQVAAYAAGFIGLNQIISALKGVVSGNLELSDSLVDIQKTTGMTRQEVNELSTAIDGLDTRTAQKELNDLAFQAGKLGITGVQNVYEFVKAGNQLVVALGEDLGGAEAVKQLMKINEVLGTTKTMGIEKALLATGSAINEVGQSSTANEGYIVDFAQRLGGIAAQSNLTIAEIIALGATTDALGQNVEVSATALNKFIVTLQTNTRAVAQAAGVTDTALKELIESGRTMDAIMMVFEGLSRKGGIANLAPVMKDLGGEGARLIAVLTSLISNTELMRAQLYTANQGFEEATSVTNEYNVKNENAAAILARMGNTIREQFINSGFVEWLKQILFYISDIPNYLERNTGLAIALKSAITGIVTVLSLKGLKSFVTFLGVTTVQAITKVTSSVNVLMRAIAIHTAGVTGARKAWIAFNLVLKSNFVGILLTAVVALGTALYNFATKTTIAEDALKAYREEVEKDIYSLDKLTSKIREANVTNGERDALILEFNNKYSQYLGYMLTEKDSAEDIARAYALVNAQLRERAALQAKDEALKKVNEKYVGSKVSVTSDLRHMLETHYQINEEELSDMLLDIQELIYNGETNAVKIITDIENKYSKETGLGQKIWDSIFEAKQPIDGNLMDLKPIIEKYIKVRKRELQEIENVESTFDSEIKALTKKTIQERETILSQLISSIFTDEALSEAESSKTNLQKFINTGEVQIAALEALGEKETQRVIKLKEDIERAKKGLTDIQKGQLISNPWGEGTNLESASVDQLVAKYKELSDLRKEISSDKDYSAFSSSGFSSRAEEMDALMTKMNEVKKRLNDLGYTEAGKLLKNKNNNDKEIKAQREIISELTNGLDTYFSQRENAMRDSYLKEEITATQLNEQLKQIEMARNEAHAELRKAFLKQESNFLAEQYNMDAEQQEKLNNLTITDDKLKGEQQKQLEEALQKEKEIRIKHRQEIEKIITTNDPLLRVRTEYQQQLEALGLFQRNEENLTKEGVEKRMQLFTIYSKNSRELTVDMLRESLVSNTRFADYTKNMKQEEYAALLILLQNYLDASEEAEIRAQERRQRIIKKTWEQTDEAQGYKNRETKDDAVVQITRNYQSMGLASQDDVVDAELESIKTRWEALRAYYDYSKAVGMEDLEAKRQLAALQMEMDNKYLESQQLKMERMRQYTDALVTFSEEMGAAAFGEVEDRKKAGQQLIKTLIDTTKKLIVQWATQKAMNLFYKQAMNVDDAAQAVVSQQIQVAESSQEVATQAAQTNADVALSSVSATAKEAGKLGFIGLAVGAAIAAALGALLSAAMGKAKSSMSSVGGNISGTSAQVKKLAPGMLTYAEGRYPVLGNDGQIYRAKYEDRLQTGVYGGGAHYGIFSEKQPEMVIDGPTTQRMMLNHRELYDSIMFLSRHKHLPTYAQGKDPYEETVQPAPQVSSAEITDAVMRNIAPVLEANTTAINRLYEQLARGVQVNTYGPGGLALKIIWKDRKDILRSEWAVLGKDQSISIERTNPVFNESGTFSYPFPIPYTHNRHIFGELSLPENEKRIDEFQYKFELYSQGLFILTGDVEIAEGEITDTIDLQLRSGNNTFWNSIKDLNCRQVNQAKEVTVANIVEIKPGGRNEPRKVIEPVYNVRLPYPQANFCSVRIILNPVTDTDDDGNEIIRTPVFEPSSPYAGICFYVLYLLDCLFNTLHINVTENDALAYEDFKRLAFFVTTRVTRQVISSDQKSGFVYATSDNFPDKTVTEVLESLKAAFGLILIIDEFSNSVRIKLLKNILTNSQSDTLTGRVISVSKVLDKSKNVVIKYEGDKNDTSFTYNDYGNVTPIPDYNTLVDMYSKGELRDDDIFCYLDAKTGNAYRVKVDNETNTDPVIFEVAQFTEYAATQEHVADSKPEEITIGFTPVIINDVTLEEIRKKPNYIMESAVHVNHTLEITVASTSTTERPSNAKPQTRSNVTDRISTGGAGRKKYHYDAINKHDTGFVLGIMRGPGSNETIDTSINDYKEEVGGNSFVKLAGSMAFTSDSVDLFGRDYDYNGADGGVGDDPLHDRFSLKLKAVKPGFTATAYPDRGLIDTFLTEYIYFLQNRRVVNITLEMSMAALISIDWEKKYHIGEYFGFINRVSFTVNTAGVSEVSIELYMI